MEEPERRTIAGVAVVTIPVDLYAELLDCRRQLAEIKAVRVGELKAVRRVFNAPPRSRIGRDPEVAAFVAERLGKSTVPDIERACLARFGKRRAPNHSAISRYHDLLRRQAAWEAAGWPRDPPPG